MLGEELRRRIDRLLDAYNLCGYVSNYNYIYILGVEWAASHTHEYLRKNGYDSKILDSTLVDAINKHKLLNGDELGISWNEGKSIVVVISYKLDFLYAVSCFDNVGIDCHVLNCFDKRDSHFYLNAKEKDLAYEIKNILGIETRDELIKWLIKANAESGRQKKHKNEKIYIFMTADVSCIGGMQLYTLGKTSYLEARGWKVYVFHCGIEMYESEIPGMKRFVGYSVPEISNPIENYSFIEREDILKIMESYLGEDISFDRCVIESHSECLAVWAELLAQKIKAKHFIFNCNEIFRGESKYYTRYIEFFKFKHNRGELATTGMKATRLLFEGTDGVAEDKCLFFDPVEMKPIAELTSYDKDSMVRNDFNVCYFGRTQKGYFNPIVEGVLEFADMVKPSVVQFVVIGALDERQKNELVKKKRDNIVYTFLGNMVPVPLQLFENVDVVVAGSDSAYYAALTNIPVIIADAKNFMANGVYGYDTFDLLYSEDYNTQMTFKEAIYNTVVLGKYKKKKCFIPIRKSEEEYDKQMKLIDQSSVGIEYYHFEVTHYA